MKVRIFIYPLILLMAFVSVFTIGCKKKDEAPSKNNPVITWANPADIIYGTLLSATQLNATADVPGTFVYTPATGTKLNAGANQELKVTFTPTNTATYNTTSKTVKINIVAKKTPVISWTNPADIMCGTLLSATQLNATADLTGTFVYTPAIGTKLNAGANQELKVTFTPTDGTTNDTASKTVIINVIAKRIPVITWATPANILYGTLLSATQLNATADVAGTFIYTPAATTKPDAGTNQVLKVSFTPTDAVNNDTISKTVKINVIAVGVTFQGGIVAYILQVGDPGYVAGTIHGLIISPSDQNPSQGIQWNDANVTTTGATATALGTGTANTNAIIASQGNTGSYAAKLCADLDLGGYTDWYLPSKDELNKIYINRVAIGGIASSVYWTSTEFNLDNACYHSFISGSQFNTLKSTKYRVRAVRAF